MLSQSMILSYLLLIFVSLVIRELVQLHCVYRGGGVNGAKGASQAAAVGKQELFDPFAKMSSFLELIPTSFENKEKQRR